MSKEWSEWIKNQSYKFLMLYNMLTAIYQGLETWELDVSTKKHFFKNFGYCKSFAFGIYFCNFSVLNRDANKTLESIWSFIFEFLLK